MDIRQERIIQSKLIRRDPRSLTPQEVQLLQQQADEEGWGSLLDLVMLPQHRTFNPETHRPQ